MKTIEFIVETAIEDGYTVRALGESIYTEGDDINSLRVNIVDAVNCHFETDELPEIVIVHEGRIL